MQSREYLFIFKISVGIRMLKDGINVVEWFCANSLFPKMQRGISPSFELLQLDMYGVSCTCILIVYKANYKRQMNASFLIFLPPAGKVNDHGGHLEIGPSVPLSVCNSVPLTLYKFEW